MGRKLFILLGQAKKQNKPRRSVLGCGSGALRHNNKVFKVIEGRSYCEDCPDLWVLLA